MTKTLSSRTVLNNGVEMPCLGLGTFGLERGEGVRNSIRLAFESGYRLIDTATSYGNEKEIGKAIAESPVPRSEIFVTTKVWHDNQGYDKTRRACDESLKKLGLAYVDLYLIHWPVGKRQTTETWRAMIRLLEEGKCRAIGVCNFTIGQLDHLSGETTVVPSVNQVEFHPFCFQKDLLEFCRNRAIQLEAYGALTHAVRLHDQAITSIAVNYRKSTAQIMLRWALQHDVVVLAKSSNKNRIIENAAIFDFEISSQDMSYLDSLNEDARASWYPKNWPPY